MVHYHRFVQQQFTLSLEYDVTTEILFYTAYTNSSWHGSVEIELSSSSAIRVTGRVSYGHKWKIETGRQYFKDIIGLSSTTVLVCFGFGVLD